MRARLLIGLLLVASVVLPPPIGPHLAYANAIVVNTTADEYGSGASCSLREAIHSANSDTAFGGCTAGSGTDTILLQAGQTYALTTRDTTQFGFNGSPVIRSTIVIEGNGAKITRANGAGSFRLFHVARSGDTLVGGVVAGAGDLTLRNVTLRVASVAAAAGPASWRSPGASAAAAAARAATVARAVSAGEAAPPPVVQVAVAVAPAARLALQPAAGAVAVSEVLSSTTGARSP
jgi:CSLREA domain-containing protein